MADFAAQYGLRFGVNAECDLLVFPDFRPMTLQRILDGLLAQAEKIRQSPDTKCLDGLWPSAGWPLRPRWVVCRGAGTGIVW